MAGPEARFRQTLTHWSRSGVDAAGDASFSAPTTMLGHWTERADRFIAPGGEEKYSSAVAHVALDVAIGDYLAEGTDTTADPITAGAREIGGFRKSMSPNGARVLRRAYLT